jgi:very-short-patch-repair endonuclease
MKPFKIIEIDGEYHLNNQEYDKMREAEISKTRYRKYKFLRITNEEVFKGQALIILKSLYKRKFK